ncbi:MAG: hypothetical protein JWM74_4161 [Myxococcaceae bacterium]|nr:hypothetical protein [Myxococcaceae bacterium]
MGAKPKQGAAELRREVRQLRTWVTQLAKALHKHARTDLAPDAALPELQALVDEINDAGGG